MSNLSATLGKFVLTTDLLLGYHNLQRISVAMLIVSGMSATL
jgi:hypothetical protein